MSKYLAHFVRLSVEGSETEQTKAIENLLDTVREGYELIATNSTDTVTEYLFRKPAPPKEANT